MTIQEMIQQLAGYGFSQQAIADAVGTTQPTIFRASKGGGLRYETGKAIEELCRKERNRRARRAAA